MWTVNPRTTRGKRPLIYHQTDTKDEAISHAAKRTLAARHQGRLTHRSRRADCRARSQHALLFARVFLVQRDKQADAQQPVLRLEDLLESVGLRRRHTCRDAVDLLRDVLLNFWVQRVLEDLDAEQVWSLLVARVDQPLELRVLVQYQCNPIERERSMTVLM